MTSRGGGREISPRGFGVARLDSVTSPRHVRSAEPRTHPPTRAYRRCRGLRSPSPRTADPAPLLHAVRRSRGAGGARAIRDRGAADKDTPGAIAAVHAAAADTGGAAPGGLHPNPPPTAPACCDGGCGRPREPLSCREAPRRPRAAPRALRRSRRAPRAALPAVIQSGVTECRAATARTAAAKAPVGHRSHPLRDGEPSEAPGNPSQRAARMREGDRK